VVSSEEVTQSESKEKVEADKGIFADFKDPIYKYLRLFYEEIMQFTTNIFKKKRNNNAYDDDLYLVIEEEDYIFSLIIKLFYKNI